MEYLIAIQIVYDICCFASYNYNIMSTEYSVNRQIKNRGRILSRTLQTMLQIDIITS